MLNCKLRVGLLAGVASLVLSTSAQAGELTGAFEVGAALTNYTQSDDSSSGTPHGGYADAFLNVPVSDVLELNLGLKAELLNVDGGGSSMPSGLSTSGLGTMAVPMAAPSARGFDYTAPNHSGAITAAVNYKAGPAKIGVFGSIGLTNQRNDGRLGYTIGGQASFDLGKFTPFAQVGYARIRVDGTDSGFTGLITRGGVQYNASDKMAFTLDGSYGHANKGYEDTGDSGTYWNLGGKAIVHLTGPVYATLGYDYREFIANTEDQGHEHAFRLGVSIPLGGSARAGDLFNNLSAPLLPFRAASYGEVLD